MDFSFYDRLESLFDYESDKEESVDESDVVENSYSEFFLELSSEFSVIMSRSV